MAEAAVRAGSNVELGRRLGYKSGAFVQQMISGHRPVTEKTVAAVHALHGFSGWFEKQPVDPSTRASEGLEAHELIPGSITIAPQRIKWEQLVTRKDLGDLFVTTLPDDALAPEHPRGLDMIWSTTKEPAIGRIVIVRDRYGTCHVRKYSQGREPGQWVARATNQAFASFESEEGMTIVAVAAFMAMP